MCCLVMRMTTTEIETVTTRKYLRVYSARIGFIRVSSTVLLLLALLAVVINQAAAFGSVTSRFFVKHVVSDENKPKLILISGSPGTGKSTFGMSVALDQGILKCISTDTVRAVMRSFVPREVSPALHRSSYEPSFEGDDPVRSWKETCSVLNRSVEGLVEDAMNRGTSIVVEGVHVIPENTLIRKWQARGGTAIGCLLQIADEDKHKELLRRRGFLTGVMDVEEKKIDSFDRIRKIQQEMMRLAQLHNWLQIEQRTGPDPLDLVTSCLTQQVGDSPSLAHLENDLTEHSKVDTKQMTDKTNEEVLMLSVSIK